MVCWPTMSTTLTHGPLLLADNDGKYGVALKKTELASPSHTMFFTFFRAAWNARRTRKVSVRLSNACIVTKRKKDLSRFLYHTKDHLA